MLEKYAHIEDDALPMTETSEAQKVELLSCSGLGLRFAGQWHDATDVKYANEYVDFLSNNTQIEEVYGSLPALAQIQLRQPWSHVVKWGVEAWSPSMRLLDEQGAVQMQCTRKSYSQTFSLFGDQRRRMQELLASHEGRIDDNSQDISSHVTQGLPLPEDIAEPNSQALQEAPLWLQVVATIQHLRHENQWQVAHGFDNVGYNHNTDGVELPAWIERERRNNVSATTVTMLKPEEDDIDLQNECLVDVQIRNYQKLIDSVVDLLGNVSVQNQENAVRRGRSRNNKKGATHKISRKV